VFGFGVVFGLCLWSFLYWFAGCGLIFIGSAECLHFKYRHLFLDCPQIYMWRSSVVSLKVSRIHVPGEVRIARFYRAPVGTIVVEATEK
jgi:hypothetical protein